MKPFLLVILLVLPTLANSSEVDELKSLVMSLNQHVVNLEKRVKELEKLVKTKPVNISLEKTTWRKLKRGMSFSQVRSILGEPKNITAGYTTFWYYTSSTYRSMVTFSGDKVMSWDEPN
jgi:outer membrane protein assembly factor BamE (lipoprotein component of BamABCDE complex)